MVMKSPNQEDSSFLIQLSTNTKVNHGSRIIEQFKTPVIKMLVSLSNIDHQLIWNMRCDTNFGACYVIA